MEAFHIVHAHDPFAPEVERSSGQEDAKTRQLEKFPRSYQLGQNPQNPQILSRSLILKGRQFVGSSVRPKLRMTREPFLLDADRRIILAHFRAEKLYECGGNGSTRFALGDFRKAE